MGMKRLCHSCVVLAPGQAFGGELPQPLAGEYWDVRTIAFPLPPEVEWREVPLVERTLRSDTALALTFDMGRPFTARSLTYSENTRAKHPVYAMNMPGLPSDKFYGDGYAEMPPIGWLEASDDGLHYRAVRRLPPLYGIHHKVKTVAFPATTARFFRLNLRAWNRPDGLNRHPMELRRASLSAMAMTDEWQNRAAVNSDYLTQNLTPHYRPGEVIDPASVIDITHCLRPGGRLHWAAPAGGRPWVVMRVAMEPTKGRTKHGRPGQMGLECDKMSAEAARLHWDNYVRVVVDSLAACGLKPLGVAMDSHEMGSDVSAKILSHRLPAMPAGYCWDACTDDALLRLMEARGGRLATRGGMTYGALVVERMARLTPEAEAKVAQLRAAGVPVYDARREGDWGLGAFLASRGIAPDAAFSGFDGVNSRLYFAHRSAAGGEIYFFVNHSDSLFSQTVTLRGGEGRAAEFWNPATGQRSALSAAPAPGGALAVARRHNPLPAPGCQRAAY